MTPDEARQLLELPPRYSRRDVDAAYAQLQHRYVQRLNYATDPRERDVASAAIALLREAYPVLTGKPPPTSIRPPCAAAAQSGGAIPRASMAGRPAGYRSGAKTPRSPAAAGRAAPRPTSGFRFSTLPQLSEVWKERIMSALIYSMICLIALLILGKGTGLAG